MGKKYLVEFIGTFFLVLVISLTGNPLAIGLVLATLVYMGGYISGAHYNPAVTLALFINKKITKNDALWYIATQLIASVAASFVYYFLQGTKFFVMPNPHVTLSATYVVEILFTFLLASVVLHTAATKETKGNNYFGMAIGFTVLAGAYAGGPISGGAFNPAVGIGPLLFDITHITNHLQQLLLYSIGPLVGGIGAGLVNKKIMS